MTTKRLVTTSGSKKWIKLQARNYCNQLVFSVAKYCSIYSVETYTKWCAEETRTSQKRRTAASNEGTFATRFCFRPGPWNESKCHVHLRILQLQVSSALRAIQHNQCPTTNSSCAGDADNSKAELFSMVLVIVSIKIEKMGKEEKMRKRETAQQENKREWGRNIASSVVNREKASIRASRSMWHASSFSRSRSISRRREIAIAINLEPRLDPHRHRVNVRSMRILQLYSSLHLTLGTVSLVRTSLAN